MAAEIYKNDPVIKVIDKTIRDIEKETDLRDHESIPTRKQVLDAHMAFLKVILMK